MKKKTNQTDNTELLSDEKQSIVDDLKRVTDTVSFLKTQVFKCKGNMFIDKETQFELLKLMLQLEDFKVKFIKKQLQLQK